MTKFFSIYLNNISLIMKYFILFLVFCSLTFEAFSKDFNKEFLVAKPSMNDPRFEKTVILMLYHNQSGAAGLVLNKPIKQVSISTFFDSTSNIDLENILNKKITIYWGGPVNPEQIFCIHSSDYNNRDFILLTEDFVLTQKLEVLIDIAKNQGPNKYVILSGIAVWSAGQLDFEIQQGRWEKKLSSNILLFNNSNEMWNQMINSRDI